MNQEGFPKAAHEGTKGDTDKEKGMTRRTFLKGMAAAGAAAAGALPESADAGQEGSREKHFASLLAALEATDEQKEEIRNVFDNAVDMERNLLIQQLTCHGGGTPKVTEFANGNSFKVTCR